MDMFSFPKLCLEAALACRAGGLSSGLPIVIYGGDDKAFGHHHRGSDHQSSDPILVP